MRENKGKSIILLPDDYVVIDIETTGLSSDYDEIIELAAIKIHNGEVIDKIQTLIKPTMKICSFITELTGITNEMVKDAPNISETLPDYFKFIGDSIVLGHNVSFDVNFIYDVSEYFGCGYFSNDYVDTMRIFRKLCPEDAHHRLKDMVKKFNVDSTQYHRALADCMSTYQCFEKMKESIKAEYSDPDDFVKLFNKKYKKYNLDARKFVAETEEFDETHPLYGKSCVFTGALEKMTRAEAMQIVVNIGGLCENNVTKNTNFLILGNHDYCNNMKSEKSNKMIKAEKYKLKGQDISIIPENVFYDMIEI